VLIQFLKNNKLEAGAVPLPWMRYKKTVETKGYERCCASQTQGRWLLTSVRRRVGIGPGGMLKSVRRRVGIGPGGMLTSVRRRVGIGPGGMLTSVRRRVGIGPGGMLTSVRRRVGIGPGGMASFSHLYAACNHAGAPQPTKKSVLL
jgi:hypothetical protein